MMRTVLQALEVERKLKMLKWREYKRAKEHAWLI